MLLPRLASSLLALSLLALSLFARPAGAAEPAKPAPSPNEIVAMATPSDWQVISPADLMVMDLAPDAAGKPRRVVIQLMPEPLSQGWVRNIRALAAARWWDDGTVYRVQDNYVTQWGDATEKKPLPGGLATMAERDYLLDAASPAGKPVLAALGAFNRAVDRQAGARRPLVRDGYAALQGFFAGWPLAGSGKAGRIWPVHCYGMVGVARDLSPNTGSGAELYTVIGHAPRHLDRNIALVGRVIEGMEHLSSLPRGAGALGFYDDEKQRVPIRAVRMGNDVSDLPAFAQLDTTSAVFVRYAEARINRRDPFFIAPAGGADICNIPVPVRRQPVP